MTGIISALHSRYFEDWISKIYPDIFNIWELQYSGDIDLDEYINNNHYSLILKWNKYSLFRDIASHINNPFDLIIWIRDNFEPEDIFRYGDLSDWAFREGYLP